jgi:acylphosphatase
MPRSSSRAAKRFFLSGRVQGVGFRYFAEYTAQALGVSGYVRNLSDGRVEVYGIGTPDQLAEFEKRLAQGPRTANVTRVDVREEPVEASVIGFSVRY